MPSKSRKKIKGQARKAKARAEEAAAANPEQRSIYFTAPKQSICNHGQGKQRPPDVVIEFTNMFVQSFSISLQCTHKDIVLLVVDALSTTYNNFPEALNNKSYRQFVKKNIICNGANYLLGERGFDIQRMSVACAATLMLIDSFDPSSPVSAGTFDERDAKKFVTNGDVLNGCKRSLVKYFVNCTPCNCLDELYSKVRSTTPKMSKCVGCGQQKQRSSMFICTGCKRIQYCSKECQIAHVPIHKEEINIDHYGSLKSWYYDARYKNFWSKLIEHLKDPTKSVPKPNASFRDRRNPRRSGRAGSNNTSNQESENEDTPPPSPRPNQRREESPPPTPRSGRAFDPKGVGHNLYDSLNILGLGYGASFAEVNARFKKLALLYHPDKYKKNTDLKLLKMSKTDAVKRFRLVKDARNYLKEVL